MGTAGVGTVGMGTARGWDSRDVNSKGLGQ